MPDLSQLYDQLTKAFDRRAWPEVRERATRLLSLTPRHPGVYYMLGVASMESGDTSAAAEALRRATLLEPQRVGFIVQYAKALAAARRDQDAKDAADRAMALSPTDPATLDVLGVIFTQVGDYDSAAAVFRQATTLAPEHAPFRYNRATSLIACGDHAAAEVELEACLSLNPHHWWAHATLAQLRRQTPQDNHVTRLQQLLQQVDEALDTQAATCLNIALAKEYEDLADYPKSFRHLVRAKSVNAAKRAYSSQHDEALFAAITGSFPDVQTRIGECPSNEPIFILGMPRSGTTLVERIISSHPDVQSAGELLSIATSVKYLSRSRTTTLMDIDTVMRARDADLGRLGEMYLASTRPLTGKKPRFVDKLPHNFLYAGYIANAMPNARIICLRRDPMDTCLSNFRQLFGERSPFFGYSFDLLDTGRYYILFDRLMAHWQRVLPGRILEVNYEDLVESQEASSRRLLEFCGLSWHDECLRFETNPAPVSTASAVQVRAPIYRSSLKRWKKYGAQLDGLRDLLLEAGIELDPS
jgi:Flp pilus assembly protein TadD